jgi:hypothetical protein
MARLYSDLLDSGGRRYYFNLLSAPGGTAPASQALLTILGRAPTVQELSTVFRTPTQAIVTLQGTATVSDTQLRPAQATVSIANGVVGLQKQQVITNAIPSPVEAAEQSTIPTILFISTISPTTGLVTMQSLTLNVTQGGNIGFINPGKASLAFSGLPANILQSPPDGSVLTLNGLTPTLVRIATISNEVGVISITITFPTLGLPFGWVDDEHISTPTWIDEVVL